MHNTQVQLAQSATPRVVVTGEEQSNCWVPRVDSIGPLGAMQVLDTPYTIGILPPDLIENSAAVNFKDVPKYLPLATDRCYWSTTGPATSRARIQEA